MKNDIIIEKAKLEDAQSIILININGWKKTYKNIFPEQLLKTLDLKQEISIYKCKNKIREYIVCKYNNKVIGFARYGRNKKDYSKEYAEVYAIYIKNGFQRKGIGTSILQYIFNDLKTSYKYVLISTLKENNANLFYKKMGGTLMKEIPLTLEGNIYKENLYRFIL